LILLFNLEMKDPNVTLLFVFSSDLALFVDTL
jgi:hypothetical protein